ncbi:MAG: hypothetical protein QG629_364 [Patescibacteria group bacterium]|nr:hypothetical protein [Patescibacteria group bacterium]
MCEVEFWEVFYGRCKSVFRVVLSYFNPLVDYRIGNDKEHRMFFLTSLLYTVSVYKLLMRKRTNLRSP